MKKNVYILKNKRLILYKISKCIILNSIKTLLTSSSDGEVRASFPKSCTVYSCTARRSMIVNAINNHMAIHL